MPSLPFSSSHFQLRHLILLLCTACLTLIFANSILLNFTIICMDGPATAITDGNGTTDANKSGSSTVEMQQQRHHFSPLQRSALFSATAVGAILGAVPINLLTRRFSIRRTLTGYGFLSAVATLATPLGHAWFGFPALLLSRILQGTSFPAEYMMNSAVSRVWGPAGSTATYLQLVSSHFQLGPIWIMPAASYFCECPWGWAGIYHLQGLLTIAFFLLFLAIFRDHPSEHPWITERELKQIQMGKAEDEDKESRQNGTKGNDAITVPYSAILRDWAVWLLMLALFSDELGFQIYTQLGPYYLNKVLGIGIASAGLFSALPYIVSMVAKLITGPINDRLLAKVMSENGRIKLFAAISQYGIAFSLASLAFLPLITRRLWLIIPFYAMLNAFTGLDFLGVFRCTQTMAGRHSELLIVWESIVSSCVALVLPAVVNAVAPDDSLQEWTLVFACIALIMSICISVFLLFGKTRQRPWAKERSAEEEKEADRDEVAVHLEKF